MNCIVLILILVPAACLGWFQPAPKSSPKSLLLKTQLKRAISFVQPNGVDCTIEQRDGISSIVYDLEKKNPTSRPAMNDKKMAGYWRLLYTDFKPDAPSNGKLGPFIGKVYQYLDPSNAQIKNILDIHFLGNTLRILGALVAKQETSKPNEWRITFDYITNSITLFGALKVLTIRKEFLSDIGQQEIRKWEITYLDDDFRVMRAKNDKDSGNDKEAFIFILEREQEADLDFDAVEL